MVTSVQHPLWWPSPQRRRTSRWPPASARKQTRCSLCASEPGTTKLPWYQDSWGQHGAMNFAIWAAINNRDPGALSLSQFTTNHFRIGHPWISSTGTRSSDELQRLDYMTGYQASVRQMTYPVSLSSCERISKANLVGGADGSGPSYDRWIRGNLACISL